ncbi:MAG: phosphatidate cytidylyltransferase [Anaerolineae bacterium]
MVTRALSGLVMGTLIGAALFFGGRDGYALFVAAVAAVACYEGLRLVITDAGPAERVTPLILVVILFGLFYRPGDPLPMAGVAVYLGASLAYRLLDRSQSLTNWSWGVAVALYVGWLGGHAVALRDFDPGLLMPGRGFLEALPDQARSAGVIWTLLAFTITWANDTAAYLVGRVWGRRPLAASISPNKTWEGTVGGWIFSVLAAVVWGGILGLSIPPVIVLGALVGPVATGGDLVVSHLKRRAGVKDTSRLIPGHGGALDRIDSLLFTVPLVYYWLLWAPGA